MRSGARRHRIILQSKSVSMDTFGGESITWVDTPPVWASIKPLRGREYFSAQTINSDVTRIINIRYRAGLTTEWRVKFGEKIFDIKTIINLEERNKELDLMCSEVANV